MIGDASIAARLEVVHLPGFEAKAGLDYDAYIDPSFEGVGSVYELPSTSGTQVVSPSNLNYIITTSPQIAGYNPANTYNCSQVNTDITYFDGLGRKLQDVSVMASPGQKDMIQPYSYDLVGRPDSAFLPFESPNGHTGQFDASYASNQKNFIEFMFSSSEKDYGFSAPYYEASPLNRVLKQSAPGVDWSFKPAAPEQEHVVEMEYPVNSSDVTGWKVVNNSFSQISYGAGQLSINVTKNENKGSNQSITKEYKNKTGQVVLVENRVNNTWYQTFYIYDDFGLLRCVVPPKAMASVNNPGLCYYYRYDNRHRMACKKLPGADSVLLVYDKRDRLVMSQDGKMRAEGPRQWLLTCYDQFNRPVMTGIYLHHTASVSQVQMQDYYNDVVTTLNETGNGNFNNTYHGYTRNVYSLLCNSGCTFEVLSVTWYDNYLFAANGYGFDNTNGIVNQSEVIVPRNMPAGTKVKVVNGLPSLKEWIISATYYDNKYRVIQTVADNPCSDGRDVVTSKYSFAGELDTQKTSHTAFSKTTEYTEKYVYDHRGRILEHTMEGLSGQPKVMLASMHYNPLGQLAKKQTHSIQSSGSYDPFIQKTDYRYNIRGWLTSMNNPENTTEENDIFAMNLHYNDVMISSSDPLQYNGNIASVNWATNRDQGKSAYVYKYDSLNRLSKAEYYQNNGSGYSHDGSFDEKSLSYDENGNLKTLQRYGEGNTPIDQLSYTYLSNSNQLSYIIDPTGDVAGVIDYPGRTVATPGYEYDLNGNMIQSADKGINVDILYSYLNKPQEVDFGNGEKIDYIYDGAGNKLAKIVKDGNALPENSLIYAGNFVYDLNGSLQYIVTAEGRLVPDNDTYRFEYVMKDHLGNTRATYARAAPGLAQVAEYQHYYPFGMQLEALSYRSGADLANNYLYNGKELQPDYNLQWYDYGARFYDPQLGRWHTIDPKSEKYFFMTPYNYGFDNPINVIDPDGRDGELIKDGNNLTVKVTLNYSIASLNKYNEDRNMGNYTQKDFENDFSQNYTSQNGEYKIDGQTYNVSFVIGFNAVTSNQEIPSCDKKDGSTNLTFDAKTDGAGLFTNNVITLKKDPRNEPGSGSTGGTLSHEIIHGLGVPDTHEKNSEKLSSYSFHRRLQKDEVSKMLSPAIKFATDNNISHGSILITHYKSDGTRDKPKIIEK